MYLKHGMSRIQVVHMHNADEKCVYKALVMFVIKIMVGFVLPIVLGIAAGIIVGLVAVRILNFIMNIWDWIFKCKYHDEQVEEEAEVLLENQYDEDNTNIQSLEKIYGFV